MENELKYEIEKANRKVFAKLERKTLSKSDIAQEGRLVLKRVRAVYHEKYDSDYWLGYVHGAEEMLCDILGCSVDLKYDPDTDTYTFELDE